MKENERANQYIGQATRRRDQFIQERVHDPYKARGKDDGPAECPQCLAVYDEGRWRWAAGRPKAGAEKELCPACHRINDAYPAGGDSHWRRLRDGASQGDRESDSQLPVARG